MPDWWHSTGWQHSHSHQKPCYETATDNPSVRSLQPPLDPRPKQALASGIACASMDKMLLRLARAAPIDSSARSYLCQLARSISLADRPVEAAERVLRKALVAPHEHIDDLNAIAACSRLKAWLRKDHIDRRYRGSDRYMRAATTLRDASATRSSGVRSACSNGAPGMRAAAASKTAGNTSYSTSTSRHACSAACEVSATTAATRPARGT